MQRAYRQSTRVFGVLMMLLGATLVVYTIARGGGPVSYGVIVGVMFAALGAARLYLASPPHDKR